MNVDSFTDFDSQPIVFQIESYLDNYEVEIWEWDIKREWETGEHNIALWKFLLLSKQASTFGLRDSLWQATPESNASTDLHKYK